MTSVPHFDLPFRFATPQVAVNEQDSVDDVTACVLAVLLCPVGFRVELPDFGSPDPTFSAGAVDLDAIREAIDTWEPRAAVLLDQFPDLLDQLVQHVGMTVQVRTEE